MMKSQFAKNIRAWKREGELWADRGDQEMVETHERDVRDLHAVYDAVRDGDYALAANLACRLDTVVRDQIPEMIYKKLV